MSKGLEVLQELIFNVNTDRKYQLAYYDILKELKAFEIIRHSVVATPDILTIKTPKGNFVEITLAVEKEEYELLKEVLL